MTFATLNITTPVPCIQGRFGNRLFTYSTQIQPLQLRKILGHDPRSKNWKQLPESTRNIYERIQRPTSKDRLNSVAGYLQQRLGSRQTIAAFPAISIGISHPTVFKPLEEGGAVGILQIHDEGERIVLDGLGRLAGCYDLAEEPDGRKLVEQIVFPVTFFVPATGTPPLSLDELGQLFTDFNFRVHPVPARVNIALDQSDIYIAMANQLAKEPFIHDFGGMEIRAASLGKKSTAIVVQSVLVRTVRGACEGRDFQESHLASTPKPNLTDSTFQRELRSISEFFNTMAELMGPRWKQRDSLHLSSPGWQALGVIHHDLNHRGLNLQAQERQRIYQAISEIDWSRHNRQWVDEARLGEWAAGKDGTEQVVIRGAGRNNTQNIIDYVRQRSGLSGRLAPLASQNHLHQLANTMTAPVPISVPAP